MTYPGGKNGSGVYQKIINLMPPHTRYYEPFLGGGAIMRHKLPAPVNVGLDLDPASPGLAWLAGVRDRAMPARAGVDRASPVCAMRSRYVAHNGCGLEFLETHAFHPSDLIYCDPPYVMETRSSGPLYRFEFSDVDHRRLLRCVLALPAMVMISGYWSGLYAVELEGWQHVTFQAMTRGGRLATEWLWFNFPAPLQLHDYRYLGDGFRERERIHRQQRRWCARLRRMDVTQRQALLAAIASISDFGEGGRHV